MNPEAVGSLCVLVVDDCRDTADTMAALLNLWGYRARQAYDGPTALALAQSCLPDVVLLDLGLPGMDGLQLARLLRQPPRTSKPVLIAITGYGQSEDRRRCAEAEIHLHLIKPVEPERIHEVLEAIRASTLPAQEPVGHSQPAAVPVLSPSPTAG